MRSHLIAAILLLIGKMTIISDCATYSYVCGSSYFHICAVLEKRVANLRGVIGGFYRCICRVCMRETSTCTSRIRYRIEGQSAASTVRWFRCRRRYSPQSVGYRVSRASNRGERLDSSRPTAIPGMRTQGNLRYEVYLKYRLHCIQCAFTSGIFGDLCPEVFIMFSRV